MNHNMITVIKKEFARFFGDKRLLMTTVLLPGLMIYVMYSFMGKAMANQFTTAEDHIFEIHTVNLPASFEVLKSSQEIALTEIESNEADLIKSRIADQKTDLLLIFPENFDRQVAAYDSVHSAGQAPSVGMYYNSVSTESSSAYNMLYGMFDEYESSLANKFDINSDESVSYNLATEKDTTGQIFSMMLPMLMMMFLFSGCMAIAPESIAGEKERGTIATLLVTPIKRSQLATGKIISLSVIGLLSGLSSFLGTMLAIPQLMGVAAADEGGMSASVYGGLDYVFILLVILSSVLVIIGLISIVSGLSRSVKEAGTAVTPLMLIVMVIGITSMFGNGAPKEMYWYFIPLYNSVQCMNSIFSFEMVSVNLIITVASNVVYTLIMAGVLAKIFDSEKIMYN